VNPARVVIGGGVSQAQATHWSKKKLRSMAKGYFAALEYAVCGATEALLSARVFGGAFDAGGLIGGI
jgi:hypothetical protein